MIKITTLIILLLSSIHHNGLSQERALSKDSLQTEETEERVFHGTISINPLSLYIPVAQIHLGVGIENSKFGCSLNLNSGLLLDYFNYALFGEGTYKFYEKKSRQQRVLSLKVPLWVGYRNFFPLNKGEEYSRSEFKTYLHLGTGINVRYNLRKRLSFYTNIGMGIGPKFISAGDFNFGDFKYDGIKILPKLDLAIAFHFWK